MSSIVLAKRKNKPFDMAMDHIWLSIDSDQRVGNYVLVHFLNHSELFGDCYVACYSLTELNEIKSKILNNNFKIDWDVFSIAMTHLIKVMNSNLYRIEALKTQVGD